MNKAVKLTLYIGIPLITCGLTFGVTYGLLKNHYEKKHQEDQRQVWEVYYNGKIALYEEENKHLSNVDVSFIGDSLTDGYDVKKFYPQYNVVNRGIAGDTTFGVEKRMKQSVYDVHPKVATLLIGANNFDSMFENYSKILDCFKNNAPSTKVVLLSLTSMTYDWARNNQKAIDNNVRIKAYADEYGFTFVDLFNPLLDPETNELKKSYTIDGGHFTEEGYTKITSIITPVLETLL